jgi:hypothetical protein
MDTASPPDPIRGLLSLDINTPVLTDVDHRVTMSHGEGSGITPCMRVLHEVVDGEMLDTIDLVDPASALVDREGESPCHRW